MRNANKVQKLIDKGVRILAPASVQIGEDADPERISGDNVVIHAGCRILGKSTLILQGSSLGAEGPVTVVNCQIGRNVDLRGGFFRDAVFLDGTSAGSGAHVRKGTILEEEASIAHTVGLKQTILLPFVTLGSLINFCDCLMAGGSDRKNHSEVGSAYIHFNFTPHQDKATASLIGDVPRGVMLNQAPIFLGGQGGLVGPCRLAYGTVIAAGTIHRKDELRPGRLIFGDGGKGGNVPFAAGRRPGLRRILTNNITYVANLCALGQWYATVRSRFVSADFPQPLLQGLQEKLHMAVDERIERLGELMQKTTTRELRDNSQSGLPLPGREMWPDLKASLNKGRTREGDPALRDRFIGVIEKQITRGDRHYLRVIKNLTPRESRIGSRWLQGIVDEVTDEAYLSYRRSL
jgi:UDP-N-acetylglucosamine/UDP-N-acetylgalactosamine diphosphorylase